MKAYELLDSPDKWCKGSLCCTKNGRSLQNPRSITAVCWCLEGIIKKCYGDKYFNNRFVEEFQEDCGYDPYEWNDAPERTWEDVHKFLKEHDL